MGLIVFTYFFYAQDLSTELNSYSKNYNFSKSAKLIQAEEENFDMYQQSENVNQINKGNLHNLVNHIFSLKALNHGKISNLTI